MEMKPFNEARFKAIAGDAEAEYYNYMPRRQYGHAKSGKLKRVTKMEAAK